MISKDDTMFDVVALGRVFVDLHRWQFLAGLVQFEPILAVRPPMSFLSE